MRFPRPWRDAGEPLPAPSEHAAARLLDMTHERLVFSVGAVPLVWLPFVAWLVWLGQDARALAAWTVLYFAAALAMRRQRRAYRADAARLAPGAMVGRWLPAVHRTVGLHGAGLAVPAVLTAGQAPFEFTVLLLISIAAIMAANATHQTPVLSAFQRFFAVGWGSCVALIPWSFPAHWPFVLPLALLYTVAIYRHALIAHRFFLQQVQLEEDGKHLAERYRLAKEQAEQALAEKNRFLTTASHDLRQPVHAMGFLIESIAHRNRDAALVPALEDLRSSVRSMNLMFNSLLDLSKIEAGVVGTQLGAVPLGPMLDDVATLFREEARLRGLALRLRLPAGGATVQADAALLRQSLVNLAHNALRYTQHGGVLIGARRRGSHWQLEVWDTGIGVAGTDKARVYSPFYRDEFAWRVDSAGHGLGLAVVARCAELMNASYGLSSIEGRGSRFWLRLPAAAAGEVPALPRPLSAGASAARGLAPLSGRCLVVEDDPQVAAAWRSLMQAWGVDVRCAASSREAFDVLDAGFRPDAILCDQRLRSGESGFELLKELFTRCPEAGAAMVSGEFASEELRRAERDGYLVLRKPLEPAQLHTLLASWGLAGGAADSAPDQAVGKTASPARP